MARPSGKKIALFSGLGLVALILIGLIVLAFTLDGIVRSTVEKETTAQLDLNTTLNGADVSLFGSNVRLSGLDIANPEGYTAPHLFTLGDVRVDAGYGDLLGEPVTINNIQIRQPRLVLERKPGDSLADLARFNLRELVERLSTGEGETTESTKLLINQITVEGAQVVIVPNIEGLREQYSVTIPTLTLAGIGTAEEAQTGAEIGRVATELATALAAKASESEDLPAELRSVLKGDLKSVVDTYAQKGLGEVNEELRKALGDQLGGELGTALEQATRGDTEAAEQQVRQTVEREVEKQSGELRQEAEQEIDRAIGNLLGGNKKKEPAQSE